MAYPTTIDTFSNPSGTSLLSNDHALEHRQVGTAVVALENVIGTTAGTSVLKDFAAGQFAARVNSGGTIVQTLIGGTINNTILGTPAIIGGTINNTILGTIVQGSDATGDMYYRNSGGVFTRLPIGTPTQSLIVSSGTIPSWGSGGAGATAATQAEVATGTDNTKMVTPLAATGFDTRTATLTNKTYSSPIFSGTSTKLSQTVRMLAYSTQIGLSAAYNQANNTNEQEVTNLRISLPIIAATCTVALSFVGYVSVGAANNTLRLRCGTSTSYLSNTEVAQAYIGSAKSIEALPIIANFSADLSTQTYVVFSCQADANPTAISMSASGNRTSIVAQIFV